MVWHHTVVHVEHKQRHRQRKDVNGDGTQDDIPVEATILLDDAPEPVPRTLFVDVLGASVKAKSGANIDGRPAIALVQLIQANLDGGLTQLGVHDRCRARFHIHINQSASTPRLKQQDHRK